MQKKPSIKIIEALGEAFFTNTLGMTERTLRHARTQGTFASGWYKRVHFECISQGVPCPMDAFNWKGEDKELGNAGHDFQVQSSQQTVSGAK
jgi:hypothetical protein